jgi:hypothetical protein
VNRTEPEQTQTRGERGEERRVDGGMVDSYPNRRLVCWSAALLRP